LFKTLLLQTSEYGNSSFISLFITLSGESNDLSKFLANIVENEQMTPYFSQTVKIITSCLISDTFDLSNIPAVLHGITKSLYNGKGGLMYQIFNCLYSRYVGFDKDLTINLLKIPLQEADIDFQKVVLQIMKVSKLINEILNVMPDAREPLAALISEDTKSEIELVSLGSFLILSIISNPEDSRLTNTLIEHLYVTSPYALSFIACAISERIPLEKQAHLLLCAGLILLVSTKQQAVVEMIKTALKRIAKSSDLNNLDLANTVPREALDYLSSVLKLPVNDKPLLSIMIISVCFDEKLEIISTLEELGVNNDLITILTSANICKKTLPNIEDPQALCFFTLKRFTTHPEDEYLINIFISLATNHPAVLASFAVDKVLTILQKSKNIHTMELLVKIAKLQKLGTKLIELDNPYYRMVIDQKFSLQIDQDHIHHSLNMLFGKV